MDDVQEAFVGEDVGYVDEERYSGLRDDRDDRITLAPFRRGVILLCVLVNVGGLLPTGGMSRESVGHQFGDDGLLFV